MAVVAVGSVAEAVLVERAQHATEVSRRVKHSVRSQPVYSDLHANDVLLIQHARARIKTALRGPSEISIYAKRTPPLMA